MPNIFKSFKPKPFFAMQVADHVKQKIRLRLAKACGGGGGGGGEGVLSCDVVELEAVCQEVLEEEMTRTNEILGGGYRRRRRRKRGREEGDVN